MLSSFYSIIRQGKRGATHAKESTIYDHTRSGGLLLVGMRRIGKRTFCDGSHIGSGKEPLIFEVAATRKAALCTCQRTKSAPYCDGARAYVD